MHIVIDCRFVHHSGIGRYIREIVPRLLRKLEGHRFTLLVSRREYDGFFMQQCEAAQAAFCYVEAGMYSLREQWEIPLRVPSCDVFWSLHYNAPILPLRARKKMVTIHDMAHLAVPEGMSFAKRLYARLFFWNAAHSYDEVLTDSEFSQQEILRYENVQKEKVHVHCIAVNTGVYRPCTDKTKREKIRRRYGLPANYFLFVGNAKPNKNIRRMLEAYAVFRENSSEEIALAIVGKKDGLLTGVEGLDNLMDSLGLGSSVCFTGFVADEDLPILYSAARAFVFPSLYEGFGLPPLEAMACGCPVIASDAASLPEVCGEAALYVNPYDIQDMAAKLQNLASSAQLADRLVNDGFRRVKNFSWDMAAASIGNRLENLCL